MISIKFGLLLFCIVLSVSGVNWWETGIGKSLTTQNFDEIVGKDHHVAIEFYAQFCIYCRQMQNDWDKLAEHYMGEGAVRKDVIIAKLDGGVHQQLGMRFGVQNFPSILFFKKGENFPRERFFQGRSYDNFKNWIEEKAGPEEVKKPEEKKDEKKDDKAEEKEVVATDRLLVQGNLTGIEEKLDYVVSVMKSIKTNTEVVKNLNAGEDDKNLAEVLVELNKKLGEQQPENVNFSHGFSFLFLGIVLGIGMSFTFINYKRLGKKKTMTD